MNIAVNLETAISRITANTIDRVVINRDQVSAQGPVPELAVQALLSGRCCKPQDPAQEVKQKGL